MSVFAAAAASSVWVARHPSWPCPLLCAGPTRRDARTNLRRRLGTAVPRGTTLERVA